jgi:hypothetical protein
VWFTRLNASGPYVVHPAERARAVWFTR